VKLIALPSNTLNPPVTSGDCVVVPRCHGVERGLPAAPRPTLQAPVRVTRLVSECRSAPLVPGSAAGAGIAHAGEESHTGTGWDGNPWGEKPDCALGGTVKRSERKQNTTSDSSGHAYQLPPVVTFAMALP